MRINVKTVPVRFTAEEYAHLQATAAAAGLKIETTVRKLVMDCQLRPRPPNEYADLLRELSAIGNNINQMARATNTAELDPNLAANLMAELQKTQKELNQLWKKLT